MGQIIEGVGPVRLGRFDDADKTGITLGRAYLITEEQFFDIQKQESPSGEWYGRVVDIACEDDDIPYKTFTGNYRHEENVPSQIYLDTIFEGLCETYPQLNVFK